MKKFFCFSFIAFATLSSVWGNSLQAQKSEGECAGFPIHRTPARGDTYWQYATQAYKDGHFWTVLYAQNRFEPEHIPIGGDIVIPCLTPWLHGPGPLKVQMTKAEPVSSLPVLAYIAPPAIEIEAPIISVTQDMAAFLSSWSADLIGLPAPAAPSETIAAEWPEAAPQSASPIVVKQASTKPGRYQIELGANIALGIASGIFPAFSLDNQERSGLWQKREKTVAVVSKTSTGTFMVTAQFVSKLSAHSAAVIDFGDGNITQIAGGVVARDGNLVKTQAPKTNFKKRAYVSLEMVFVKKPSKSATIARKALPIAMPAVGIVGGFAIAGPVGAAWAMFPVARAFVMNKAQRLQRQAQPPQENPAPHVQYLIATQEDEIAKLKGEIAALKLRVDSPPGQQSTTNAVAVLARNEKGDQ